jgi:hypothetical protein
MTRHIDQIPAPTLLALLPNVRPEEFVLQGQACTIGRDRGCQIMVPDPTISRLHARITPQGPRYLLTDAQSVNGTYVNGRRLTEAYLLADDDVIGLGNQVSALRYLDPDPTLPAQATLRYDEATMLFWLGNQQLELSQNQLRLLRHLYRNAGEVCSRESCAQAIWGRDYDPGMDAAALDQALTSLRAALRRADPEAALIQTRRGLGYMLTL